VRWFQKLKFASFYNQNGFKKEISWKNQRESCVLEKTGQKKGEAKKGGMWVN